MEDYQINYGSLNLDQCKFVHYFTKPVNLFQYILIILQQLLLLIYLTIE